MKVLEDFSLKNDPENKWRLLICYFGFVLARGCLFTSFTDPVNATHSQKVLYAGNCLSVVICCSR